MRTGRRRYPYQPANRIVLLTIGFAAHAVLLTCFSAAGLILPTLALPPLWAVGLLSFVVAVLHRSCPYLVWLTAVASAVFGVGYAWAGNVLFGWSA